ncbi:hypothetical protein RB653_004322 [Dictyostelium firmibasis]|uniref:Uncharacterized protein n=1 Tax=Dictyostelium firmibasis TaxID=79012 RepID=A0AAN7U0S2_9MYCE
MIFASICSISKVNTTSNKLNLDKKSGFSQFTANKTSEGLISNLLFNLATTVEKAGL